MKSKRTKHYARQACFLKVLSWFFCFGAAAFFIIFAFATGLIGQGGPIKEKIGIIMYSFILSILPLVAIAIIVKNKVKPLVYMADVIIANIIFGSVGLYLMFAVWILDTYVVTPLQARAANLRLINKEIDHRG